MINNIIEVNGTKYRLSGKKTRGRRPKDNKIRITSAQLNILKYLHVLPIPGWLLTLEEIK